MAFRGVQGGFGPMEAMQLALAIRQQKAQERQQQEKTRIDKMNAIAKLRKSRLDEKKTLLDIAQNQGALQNQRTEQDASLGQPLSIASDTTALPVDRQVAANQFIRGVNQQIAQRSPTGNIFDAPVGVAETVGGRAGVAAAQTRQEKRQEQSEVASKERRLARRSIRKADAVLSEISSVEKKLAQTPIGSDRRRQLERRLSTLNGILSQQLNEGVSGGFSEMKKFVAQDVALSQGAEAAIRDLRGFRQLAAQNPNFLGTTRGGLRSFVASLEEAGRDISNLMGGDFDQAVQQSFATNPGLSPEQRERLSGLIGVTSEGTLQARTDAKALSARIAYLVTAANNPGRFSTKQFQDNLDRFDITRGTAAEALRKLETAESEMRQVLDQTTRRVSAFQNVSPGIAGGFVGQGGETVLPPTGQTPFRSFEEGAMDTPDRTAVQATPQPTTASGVPIDPSLSVGGPTQGRGGKGASGVQADEFLRLGPNEKAAVIERMLRGSP